MDSGRESKQHQSGSLIIDIEHPCSLILSKAQAIPKLAFPGKTGAIGITHRPLLNTAAERNKMLFTRISHWLAQLFLGKELGLSVLLLRLIHQALNNPKIGDMAKFVYAKLPASWRAPLGSMSESEFVDLVIAGQTFLNKVQAILKA